MVYTPSLMYPGYSRVCLHSVSYIPRIQEVWFTLQSILDTGGIVYTPIYHGYKKNGLHSTLFSVWIQILFLLRTLIESILDIWGLGYPPFLILSWIQRRVGLHSNLSWIQEDCWITLQFLFYPWVGSVPKPTVLQSSFQTSN